jgi:hypothetical protein
MMMKMGLKMMITIVRVFMMIRKKHTGKRILIIKTILIIKMQKIKSRLKLKIKKMLILKPEREESKRENREKSKDGSFHN